MSQPDKYTTQLDALPEPRRRTILSFIKQQGNVTASELAKQLDLTREAIRQQLMQLKQQGLVTSQSQTSGSVGRPQTVFSLSNAGEHLFPKHYDKMTLLLVDTVTDTLGEEQLGKVLAAITDKQVAEWQNRLDGLSLRQKLQQLKNFYFDQDPYTSVIDDDTGLWLIEHNCPFLNLATARPAICSVTVSTLSRLLGVEVKREKRFQDGHGRCAFRILEHNPIATHFRFGFEDSCQPQP